MSLKKTILAGLVALCTISTNAFAAPVDGLASRVLGKKAARFEFWTEQSDKDFFRIEQVGRKIVITGNSDNSQAVGLNHYLKHVAKVHVSWFLEQPVQLPLFLPKVKETIEMEAQVGTRFFLNYCTYGYTMPWWTWKEWEHFIDWMALNGINLPLAITGQEAVWYEVWKEFGMQDEEIRSYFSGPAHLPWHRMANVDGFQGPLPVSWLESQKALQAKIVERERELGMTPVLPGFAGHVPGRLAELYPEADIQNLSSWCGFEPSFFLNSEDPLFAKVQKSFLEKQEELYGTDHIYGIDPFNEMDPPCWDPDYLANVSKNIYNSLEAADPDAKWLQMTWVFYYKRKNWTGERLNAYLTAVPQDRLVLLDYFCENTEVWRTTDGFYGQPYIWCYLGDFGGNTMLVGDINKMEEKLAATLRDAGSNLAGIGSTLESFDLSPQIYEYLFERAWTATPDVKAWTRDWSRLRAGASIPQAEKAWETLVDSIYNSWAFYGLGPQVNARPSLRGHGTYYTKPEYHYDNELLLECCRNLLAHPSRRDAYKYDLVNFYSQYLANKYWEVRDEFTAGYDEKDLAKMQAAREEAQMIFDDIDELLSTHKSYLLGKWIEEARAMGIDEAEKAYYEENARTLLTIWGGPVLNDYANRMWAGLVSGYYAGRWNLFFDEAMRCVENGEEMDEKAFGDSAISEFEHAWCKGSEKYASEPVGNTIKVCRKIQKHIDNIYCK